MRVLVYTLGLVFVFGAVPARAAPHPLHFDAQAWLLVDHRSGAVLVEHNADKSLAPASLTKLMTVYLVFERLRDGHVRLGDAVVVSDHARRTTGSRIVLSRHRQPTVEELIKSMLVRSANNATVALTEHVAGSEAAFVAAMNERARFWGLVGTHFTNPTGLDSPDHRSTARDLSRIAAALIRDFPEYYAWFGLKEWRFEAVPRFNSNKLLWRDASVDGMKTGRTGQAGYCLIASAQRRDMRLIATVLGARTNHTRTRAIERLLDYGYAHFETRLVYRADSPATRVRVWMGMDTMLPLGPGQNLYVTLPRGWHGRLQARARVNDPPYAPVRYGQHLGVLALTLNEQVFAEYPLVALKEIAVGGLMQRAADGVQLLLR